jgi:hypothetical protein
MILYILLGILTILALFALGFLFGQTGKYKLKFKITKPMLDSYARHLGALLVIAIMTVSSDHTVNVLQFTKIEWFEVANALWIAVLPALRHVIEKQVPVVAPVIESVLPTVIFSVPPQTSNFVTVVPGDTSTSTCN